MGNASDFPSPSSTLISPSFIAENVGGDNKLTRLDGEALFDLDGLGPLLCATFQTYVSENVYFFGYQSIISAAISTGAASVIPKVTSTAAKFRA